MGRGLNPCSNGLAFEPPMRRRDGSYVGRLNPCSNGLAFEPH